MNVHVHNIFVHFSVLGCDCFKCKICANIISDFINIQWFCYSRLYILQTSKLASRAVLRYLHFLCCFLLNEYYN